MTRDILMSSGRVPTMVMTLSTEHLLDVIQFEQQLLYLRDVQPFRVVGGVIVRLRYPHLTLAEILRIIEVAIIGRNAVIAPQVLSLGHFLAGNERLIQFFAVTRADDMDRAVGAEQLLECDGQITDRGRRRLLYEDVSLRAI